MIISILGTAGKDRDNNPTKAYYDASSIGKENGNYYNATHFLLENYKDEKFYFLGTKKAIEYQKGLIDLNRDNITVEEIEDNNLEEIYEKVYDIIYNSNESIILDVTHGFRHQPLSAIFAATLNKFINSEVDLKIIFAKQIEAFKKYEYIYLDSYIDITELSLLLTGFVRTLNFVNRLEIKDFNTASFEDFSKALLANDFKKLQEAYKELKETLTNASHNPKFTHLNNLFKDIQNTLSPLDRFESQEIYEKYLTLSELMYNKHYYLLSLTYLFEAIRLYCSYSFFNKGVITKQYWDKTDIYKINSDIMYFITQESYENYQKNFYDKNFPSLYQNNRNKFKKISDIYNKLRKLRNSLTHINPNSSNPNIDRDLKQLIDNIKDIIEKDILKDLKV